MALEPEEPQTPETPTDDSNPTPGVEDTSTGTTPEVVTPDALGEKPETKAAEDTDADAIAKELDEPGVAMGTPLVVTHKKSHKKLYIIIAVVVLVLATAVAAFLVLHKTKPAIQPATSKKSATVQKSETPKPKSPDLAKFITPTTGEVWDTAPTSVANLGYFTNVQDGETASYYKVGMHGQNTIYLGYVQDIAYQPELFEKNPNGAVSAIVYPNAGEAQTKNTVSYLKDQLRADITLDTSTHYDSLSPPTTFTVAKGQKLTVEDYAHIGTLTDDSTSSVVTRSTVETYGGAKIVKLERIYADTKLTAINYVLNTAAHTTIALVYKPVSEDLTKYTWNNGVAVTKTKYDGDSNMSPIIRGCGAAGTAVSRDDSVADSDFVAAGKSPDGQTVYAFADGNNATVQKAYNEYKEGYADVPSVTVVSFDDFLKNHGVVAYKDVNGQWLVYTRDVYAVGGGCAKPVVYLYPTHTENVSVRVGANVTVSDPYYSPTKGWNVVANPNGQLNLGSKSYDSLFWEGQGQGAYPGITGGTVVKHSEAAATIASQLKQQGLTTKEANDFLAYWTPKIPNKPYVRLTWLTKAQLDELAPLHISPEPDTVIRVFLDMDGFDSKISLPAQQLTSTPRQGFTVVEWGGLTATGLK